MATETPGQVKKHDGRSWLIQKIILAWVLLMTGSLVFMAFGASCEKTGCMDAMINGYLELTWGFPYWVAGPERGPDSIPYLICSPLFVLGLIIHFTGFFCLCWYWNDMKQWIGKRFAKKN